MRGIEVSHEREKSGIREKKLHSSGEENPPEIIMEVYSKKLSHSRINKKTSYREKNLRHCKGIDKGRKNE